MKKIVLILLVAFVYLATLTLYAQDTVKIVLDKDTKMLITSPDREAMRKLLYLDINHSVRKAIREKDGETDKEDVEEDKETKRRLYRFNLDIVDAEESQKRRKRRDSLKRAKGWESRNAWDFSVGISNYLEKGAFPNNTNKPYGLNSNILGLGYAAISSNFVFAFYEKPVSISIGGEISTHNFVFQNNRYISRSNNPDSLVQFRDYSTDFAKTLNKSSMRVWYFNVPVKVNFVLLRNLDGRKALEFDLGGSVGYRLASGSRIKLAGERQAQTKSDDFLLSNIRYGAEAGISVHSVRLFGRYDFNSLFANPQLPKLNVLTIGLKLITLD